MGQHGGRGLIACPIQLGAIRPFSIFQWTANGATRLLHCHVNRSPSPSIWTYVCMFLYSICICRRTPVDSYTHTRHASRNLIWMRLLHNLIPALADTECILIKAGNSIVCQTAASAGSDYCMQVIASLNPELFRTRKSAPGTHFRLKLLIL